MSIEKHVIDLGIVRNTGTKAEQDKAFADLRAYCEAHPEEAKAFSQTTNGGGVEDLLGAFQAGWGIFEKVWSFFSGRGGPPPASGQSPAA